jgi:hypothetical protein
MAAVYHCGPSTAAEHAMRCQLFALWATSLLLATGAQVASSADTGHRVIRADCRQWEALIRELTRHFENRYGEEEVASWYFEVWNEPNLHVFWSGSQDDYFRLYARSAAAIKSVKQGFVDEFGNTCTVLDANPRSVSGDVLQSRRQLTNAQAGSIKARNDGAPVAVETLTVDASGQFARKQPMRENDVFLYSLTRLGN